MTTPCRHCGTSCPNGAAFCCVGCEAVWHALSEGGLQNFYELGGASAHPVVLEAHRTFEPIIEELDDGTVCATVGLDGTHCAGCVWLIERMPTLVPGVVDARLNLGRGRLEVRWRPEQTQFAHVDDWLQRFGYSAYALDAGRGATQRIIERDALVRVGVSWVLAANVMLLAVALYAGMDAVSDGGLWTAARWVSMGLSGLALVYGGREFFMRAWASLRARGRLSVDLPVALGLTVGWAYSAYSTIAGVGEVWFDSVAVLVAALLTARWLHARGLRVAADAMDRLTTIVPDTARRWTESVVETVSAASLVVGDLCEVRTGDVVPADGRVVEGNGALDRSLLTGESEPVPAGPGLDVWAGETNTRGRLIVRVRAAGDETRFGRLARFISDGDGPRAPTVQLADRLTSWFIAAILGGALATAIGAALFAPAELLPRVVALLVVSCPCALGMATPLAFTVALGRAARNGIFLRGDAVFERLLDVDAVVLDKTGTLTRGVMRIVSVDGSHEVLHLAAAAERASAHPIAGAFAMYDQDAVVTHFDETPGLGVRAVVDDVVVEVARAQGGGVEVRVDGTLRATVQLGDAVRVEAKEFVDVLRARGIEVWLSSGDDASIVDQVAERVGIDAAHVMSQQSPEDKLALIRSLRSDGRVVAMLGDGVNDAASLREADVGIAMHGGVDLNALAADVQLGRDGLRPVSELFDIADQAMRAVRRNLWFSATYNSMAIGAAMAGLVGPLGAAIVMPLSSVAVVGSSLLQRPPRPKPEPALLPTFATGVP